MLMMSAKTPNPGLLKTTVFWNKRYDVTVPVNDFTSKVLSRDSNYIVDVFMWLMFGNSSISMKQPQFYKDLTRKNAFFEGWSCFKFNNLGVALGKNLKFHTSVAKGLKLKVRKFWGLIPTLVEVIEEKLIEGAFFPSPPPSTPPLPIRNRVNKIFILAGRLHTSLSLCEV